MSRVLVGSLVALVVVIATGVALTKCGESEDDVGQLTSYRKPATVKDGNTCAVFLNGELVADFFDKTRNPEGIEVPSQGAGRQCKKARQKFMKKYNIREN